MHVLLIGSGGRENAIANALVKSKQLSRLFCIPGNPGTEHIATNFNIPLETHREILNLCRTHLINFVIIGPEQPLAAGLTDFLENERITVFGPSQAAAQLESSKAFCKDFCKEFKIPTADYATFDNVEDALVYVKKKGTPIVIKQDGLAAGKGVIVATTIKEATDAVVNSFTNANKIVIEEFLNGEEASFFVVSDGKIALPIGTAQDHKRVGDGETGPNTGGMGAYSPASIIDESMTAMIMKEIITPTIDGMNSRGIPFKGILYAGLMITKDGPKLIEYNVRFGDPEAQVIIPRLEDDLLDIMFAAAQGDLSDTVANFSNKTALTVVMAAKGYPGTPVTGDTITGLSTAALTDDVIITHAGTTYQKGNTVVSGGRVINVTALSESIEDAQKKAYSAASLIKWPGVFYRKDIGWRELDRIRSKAEPKPKVEKPKAEKKPKVEKVDSQESKLVSGRKRANSETPKSVKRSS